MDTPNDLRKVQRVAEWFRRYGGVLAGGSLVVLLGAIFLPIEPSAPAGADSQHGPVASLKAPARDVRKLVGEIAGRALIRPPQVQAAVKDLGLAARLLGQLKLQGVVQLGGESVAYVQVEKQGVKTVRQGQELLEFVVKEILPGKVVLSMEGVEVALEL
jgi:hypothetical protein